MNRFLVMVPIFTLLIRWGPVKAAPPPQKTKNCHIQISSTYKTGEVKINTRHFYFAKKSGCEKMNRILSDNFSPSEIEKVQTKMEWK